MGGSIGQAITGNQGRVPTPDTINAGVSLNVPLVALAPWYNTQTAKRSVEAAQRSLDLQDGRVLHVIGLVVRAFRRARRGDPSMLVPDLGNLARNFGVGRNGRDDEEDPQDDRPAPTPTPPTPVGGTQPNFECFNDSPTGSPGTQTAVNYA